MAGRREVKNPKSCHDRALGLLAVRPRSRRELERRLLAAGFEDEEVADVLGRLERVGLIDDEAFARQLAEHEFDRRQAGRRAVAGKLAAAGVSSALSAAVLDGTADDEQERADELARRRAGRMVGQEPARVFRRLVGILQRKGYGAEIARRAARRALGLEAAED